MNYFTKHLNEVNETYFEHFKNASKISLFLLKSSAFQMLHAIIPFIPPKFNSNINSIILFLKEKEKRYERRK